AVQNSSGNTIGGLGAGERNVISGNTRTGVQLYSGGYMPTSDNHVVGNFVGVDLTGYQALANGYDGIELNSVSGNVIASNVIAGNKGNGLSIFSFGSMITPGNTIQANLIGN